MTMASPPLLVQASLLVTSTRTLHFGASLRSTTPLHTSTAARAGRGLGGRPWRSARERSGRLGALASVQNSLVEQSLGTHVNEMAVAQLSFADYTGTMGI